MRGISMRLGAPPVTIYLLATLQTAQGALLNTFLARSISNGCYLTNSRQRNSATRSPSNSTLVTPPPVLIELSFKKIPAGNVVYGRSRDVHAEIHADSPAHISRPSVFAILNRLSREERGGWDRAVVGRFNSDENFIFLERSSIINGTARDSGIKTAPFVISWIDRERGKKSRESKRVSLLA